MEIMCETLSPKMRAAKKIQFMKCGSRNFQTSQNYPVICTVISTQHQIFLRKPAKNVENIYSGMSTCVSFPALQFHSMNGGTTAGVLRWQKWAIFLTRNDKY